jgi:hypothetical protein
LSTCFNSNQLIDADGNQGVMAGLTFTPKGITVQTHFTGEPVYTIETYVPKMAKKKETRTGKTKRNYVQKPVRVLFLNTIITI